MWVYTGVVWGVGIDRCRVGVGIDRCRVGCGYRQV